MLLAPGRGWGCGLMKRLKAVKMWAVAKTVVCECLDVVVGGRNERHFPQSEADKAAFVTVLADANIFFLISKHKSTDNLPLPQWHSFDSPEILPEAYLQDVSLALIFHVACLFCSVLICPAASADWSSLLSPHTYSVQTGCCSRSTRP